MLVLWLRLDQEIEDKVQACHKCQSNQPTPPVAPLHPWNWSSRPWARAHLDFAGPFMGHMYLIMVDSHSKWIEVVVMSSITASDTILCLRSIFARFGLHEHIVTDNGPTFISTKLKEFLRKNSIKDTTPAPYHASTNELVERTVQTVKGGLKRMKEGSIQTILARFLFSYRITPQSTTGFSLAKMMMGRKVHSALDSMKPDLNQRIENEQERQRNSNNRYC